MAQTALHDALEAWVAMLTASDDRPPPESVEPLRLRLAEQARRAPAPLPAPLTSFVGREREIEEVRDLLTGDETRLVTLTGPGGVGKTRLAMRIAERANAAFPDGVWFVPLAPLRDATLVTSALANTLGVRGSGVRPLEEGIRTFLADQHALVILDNFEQVIAAAPLVADLLAACPKLTFLVTSRAVLHISGEQTYPLASLPMPNAQDASAPERVGWSPAARLFVARARAANPTFALNDENAADVAAICRRLDGLPLALELAAARTRHLPLAVLLDRLAHAPRRAALNVLAGGPQDAPERHRSLHDTIAWSYDLLTPAEQNLCRRLAVFEGGFTLDATEAVGGTDEGGADGAPDPFVLDLVVSLIDKSLVIPLPAAGGEARFGMLETIREFGLDELSLHGEEENIRDAHAAYVLALAERAVPELFGPTQRDWWDRLEAEHANLRGALSWLDQRGSDDRLLRLVNALLFFWWPQGHLAEGRDWCDRARLKSGDAVPDVHCWVTFGAGMLALGMGDLDQHEALAREAQAEAQAIDLRAAEGMAGIMVAWALVVRECPTDAVPLAESAVELVRASDDPLWLPNALAQAGSVLAAAGEVERGTALIEEALVFDRARGNRYMAAIRLSDLGVLAHDAGNGARAVQCYGESVRLLCEVGDIWYLASPMAGLAAIAARRDPARAARLLGASQALRERSGTLAWPTEQERDKQAAQIARAVLGNEMFAREQAAGRTLAREQLLAEVDAIGADGTKLTSTPTASVTGDLSSREREVLRLLVAGRTDREIAEALFISPRTASKHVGSILAKLDAGTRADAAARALRDGLV